MINDDLPLNNSYTRVAQNKSKLIKIITQYFLCLLHYLLHKYCLLKINKVDIARKLN